MGAVPFGGGPDGVKKGVGHYHYLGLRVKSLWDLAPPHVTYLGHLRQSVSGVWSAWEWIIGSWRVVLQSQIRWHIYSGHRSGSVKGSCERRISSTHFYLSGNLCNYQVGLSFKTSCTRWWLTSFKLQRDMRGSPQSVTCTGQSAQCPLVMLVTTIAAEALNYCYLKLPPHRAQAANRMH